MTVAATDNKQRTTGNGVTTAFPATIKIFAATDLKVTTINNTTDVLVNTLILNDGGALGFTVVFDTEAETLTVTVNTAPLSTEDIQILRVLPITQASDFPRAGSFPAATNENALDKNVMILQDQQEQLDRAFVLPEESSATNPSLPNPSSRRALIWDPAEDGTIINSTLDPDAAQTASAASASAASASAGDSSTSAAAALVSENNSATSETNAAASAVDAANSAASVDLSLSANNNFTGTNTFAGKVAYKDDGLLTLSTGAVTITGASHRIAAETGTTDDLDTLTGGVDGELLFLQADTGDTITITVAGNIVTSDGASIAFSGNQGILLRFDTTLSKFVVISAPSVAAASNGWAFVSAATASGVTEVDITGIDSTSGEWRISFSGITASVDGIIVRGRTSTDGGTTFDDTPNDYDYNGLVINATAVSQFDEAGLGITDAIAFTAGLGNASDESMNIALTLWSPSTAATKTHFNYDVTEQTTGGLILKRLAAGLRDTAADVDAFRFFVASGTFSGLVVLQKRVES